MGYVKNEDGLVKCLNTKGDVQWMPEHLVNDRFLMNSVELEAVLAPVHLPPLNTEMPTEVDIKQEPIVDSEFEIETIEEEKPKKVKPKSK